MEINQAIEIRHAARSPVHRDRLHSVVIVAGIVTTHVIAIEHVHGETLASADYLMRMSPRLVWQQYWRGRTKICVVCRQRVFIERGEVVGYHEPVAIFICGLRAIVRSEF